MPILMMKCTCRTESYEKQCGVSAHVLGEDFWTLAKEPTKLLIFDRDPQVMAEVERVLSEKFSYATNQVKSKPEFFEMNRKGMSKGAALAELCDRWGDSFVRFDDFWERA